MSNQNQKSFLFDIIVPADALCNLYRERELISSAIKQNKKLVVYGPRNCGKTSVLQSIIIPEFRKKNKKSFILNLDFMELKSEEDLSRRLKRGFEKSFSLSFPGKNLWNTAKEFISNLRPTLEIDPITSESSISITSLSNNLNKSWHDIFEIILKDISSKVPTLIVIDEFQDIAFVEGIQGKLRNILQYFNNIPIVLLGSKRHILTKIFSVPSAPFAQFGEDLEFKAIPYEEYHTYICERFKQKNIVLDYELSVKLQDLLNRIPEPINIVCNQILSTFLDKTLLWSDITSSITNILEIRKGRYESYLSFFSEKEQEILIAVQKIGVISQPNGKDFLKTVSLSGRSVRNIIKSLHDHSVLEHDGTGYRVADPLFGMFLRSER